MSVLRRAGAYFQLVTFEHSVFALPFAVATALYATEGAVLWGPYGWVLLAMVAARTCAMGFNRIADRHLDARNPRTRDRHLPRGEIKVWQAWVLVGAAAGFFVLASGMLNRTCLVLAPFLLIYLMAYSYAKRVTWAGHFILGTTLGLAPVGVWIGLREEAAAFPILLGSAVVFWVAGFDMIYSSLDTEFDRRVGLRSVPARFGVKAALVFSASCHVVTSGLLVALGWVSALGWVYWGTLAPLLALLAFQHGMVRPDRLDRVNQAFFHVNAVFSIALMGALVTDLLIR